MDPLSARIAEEVGYEAGSLLSSAATMAMLAAPDLSLLSLTEMASHTCRIARACNLPILVDGEQGFGNALNVRRTVMEIEAAGAAAVTIEDTVLPQPFGGAGSFQLVSLEEGRGKLRAALKGRSDPSFLIVARTSALSVAAMDDALERLTSYEREGVDAIFLSGVRSLEQLNVAREALSIPLVVGAIAPELRDQGVLGRAGVSLWVQGNQPHFAAVHAMRESYRAVLHGEAPGAIQPASSDNYVDQLLEGPLYKRLAGELLNS